MYEKVKAYVREHQMLTETDSVIAGVSGGADSVCLLFVLLSLREEMGFTLTAVHIHHGIRGETADEDESFVRALCEKEDVPLLIFHEDVPAYARAHSLGEEEAGHMLRRQVLNEAADQIGATKIALAHHRNDNAETLLLNLCRGTGPMGLAGMPPVNGRWIRPLLCVTRKEIEDWLCKRGIAYCTDETNLEDGYARNRIRNHVIPYLEEEINPRSVEHMTDTMEQMRQLDAYVEAETDRYYKKCCAKSGGPGSSLLIREEEFARVPGVLKSYVLRQALFTVAGARKDLGAVHVKALEDLMGNQVGRKVSLPYGLTAERVYEGIELVADAGREPESAKRTAEGLFRMRVFDRPEGSFTFPDTPYTKWFDYDIIKNAVVMRHRETGDYLAIDRAGDTQKLKQYFINEKIPASQRDQIWLAADGSQIMWVVGYRQNQAYQITDRTRRILEIVYSKGEGNG